MAIIPEARYTGKIKPASAAYPYGEARNISTPGDGTGTPWEEALVNDIFGFQQSLLDAAGIVPSGDPETAPVSQYRQALNRLHGRTVYDLDGLRALSTAALADGSGARITTTGRVGNFHWNSGDLKAECDADVKQGIHVPPEGKDGSNGAWVRDVGGGYVTFDMFGANRDGTDATESVQAAIDVMSARGGGVIVGLPGSYMIRNVGGVGGINFKSNVDVVGAGWACALEAFDTNDSGFVIGAPRGETDAVVTDFSLSNISVYGPPSLQGDRVGSAITIDWAENAVVDRVFARYGSDACIRVTGYGEGTFTNDVSSPFWNSSRNIRVSRCLAKDGFLNIEVEGGAEDVTLIENRCEDAEFHAIRIPSGYDVKVFGNTVVRSAGRALWIDRSRDVSVTGNWFESDGVCVAVSGFSLTDADDNGERSTGYSIVDNTLVSKVDGIALNDSYAGSADKYPDGMVVSLNRCVGDILIDYSQDFTVSDNRPLGDATANIDAWEGSSSGSVVNNRMSLRFDPSYPNALSQGGNVYIAGNIDPATGKPSRPEIQGGFCGAGSAPPTSGTWRIGDWIENSEYTPTDRNYSVPVGFKCVEAGTPGVWREILELKNEYSTVVRYKEFAGNETRTLLNFSVPNDYAAIRLKVSCMVSRAPNGDVGGSYIAEEDFVIARNLDSACVIDTVTANSIGQATASAGGSVSASDPNLAIVVTSGGPTDPQDLEVQADFTGFVNLVATIEVSSTDTLSTYGL